MNRSTCSFDPGACESQERDAKNPVTSAAESTQYLRKVAGAHPTNKTLCHCTTKSVRASRHTSHFTLRSGSFPGRRGECTCCVFVNGFAVHHIEQNFF
jgi:hypothetical protein